MQTQVESFTAEHAGELIRIAAPTTLVTD